MKCVKEKETIYKRLSNKAFRAVTKPIYIYPFLRHQAQMQLDNAEVKWDPDHVNMASSWSRA